MVAHTGFLLVTRRLADGVVGLTPKRRPSKTEFSEEDLNAWTPANVGERAVSDRKLRRAAREAASTTQRGSGKDAPGNTSVAESVVGDKTD
jgi:tRNA (adenine57-N1/adenine58-N1)-methyltransferase